MATTHVDQPIKGQECICPDGLGRVVSFDHGKDTIHVETYIGNRDCHWAFHNVQLIPTNIRIQRELEENRRIISIIAAYLGIPGV